MLRIDLLTLIHERSSMFVRYVRIGKGARIYWKILLTIDSYKELAFCVYPQLMTLYTTFILRICMSESNLKKSDSNIEKIQSALVAIGGK